MSAADALAELSTTLRAERSVVAGHVVDPGEGEVPALGLLAAAGPRAAAAPDEYAVIVEFVREGYLLHYGRPRLVSGMDPDLTLLAGDYLYALGLERLAKIGDLEATAELSDLISLVAQVHDGSRNPARADDEARAVWLATTTAIAAGANARHAGAKGALRSGAPNAASRLWDAAAALAADGGFGEALQAAAQAIDFAADFTSSRG